MWSRSDVLKWLGCVAACSVAAACAGAGAAPPPASANVCPARSDAKLTQIDLFDGDPADLAYLAPDDERKAPDTYTVKGLYDAGRHLTVRCHYGAASLDVALVKPLVQCTFSGGEAHPALACR